MGFSWNVNVTAAYAQPVKFIYCGSRFATRCLKLRVEAPQANHSKHEKKLPGESIELNEQEEFPFSDTEEEVAALTPEHQKLHAEIKRLMKGDHGCPMDDPNWYWDKAYLDILQKCFQSVVERILPGHGSKFAFRTHYGVCNMMLGHVGEGAEEDVAYIEYVPCYCSPLGGDPEGVDLGRGGVNVPWGCKLTPLQVLKDEERTQVDAAFAVLVEKLGLTATGPPGLMLVSEASGG